MKNIKVKEAELRGMKTFCVVIALAADVLCVLYLLNVVQNHWFLNFIQVLAVLLHLSLALVGFVQKKKALASVSVLLMAAYLGSFIWYLVG